MTTELCVITLTYKRDSDQDGNKKLFSLSINLSIIFSINPVVWSTVNGGKCESVFPNAKVFVHNPNIQFNVIGGKKTENIFTFKKLE